MPLYDSLCFFIIILRENHVFTLMFRDKYKSNANHITTSFQIRFELWFLRHPQPQIYWKTQFVSLIISFTYLTPLLLIMHLYSSSSLVSFELLILCHSSSFTLLLSSTDLYKWCQSCYASGLVMIHAKSHACTHKHIYAHIQTHIYTQTPSWLLAVGWAGKACLSSHACVGVEVEKERDAVSKTWKRVEALLNNMDILRLFMFSLPICLSVCHFVCLPNADVIFY